MLARISSLHELGCVCFHRVRERPYGVSLYCGVPDDRARCSLEQAPACRACHRAARIHLSVLLDDTKGYRSCAGWA
jgi:hypothetical protein